MSADRNTLSEAAARGLETFQADDTHLQLDLDRDRAAIRFIDRETQAKIWRMLVEWGWVRDEGRAEDGREGTLTTTSQGGGKHRYIRLGLDLKDLADEGGLTRAQEETGRKFDSIDTSAIRIALQAILGSDPIRELLALRRLLHHHSNSHPVLTLYETEEETVRVEKWLGRPPLKNLGLESMRHERRQRLMRSVVAPAYRRKTGWGLSAGPPMQKVRCGTFTITAKGPVVKRGDRP